MKERLKATSEHHRSKSVETAADHDTLTDTNSDISKQFEQTKVLHEKLAGYVYLIQQKLTWNYMKSLGDNLRC